MLRNRNHLSDNDCRSQAAGIEIANRQSAWVFISRFAIIV
jgi:hypothetical protein